VLIELLNLGPVYTMVQWYVRKTFRNASQVRSRAQAQCIGSKRSMHDPGSKDLWCEGWDRSKEQWARTGRRQRNTLTGENVIESIEIKVCS